MEQPDKQRQRFFSRAGITFCALFIALALNQVTFGQCTLSAVNAGSDVSICSGGSIQLTAVKTGGGVGVTYSWAPTAGLSNPNIANPIASPASTTTYTVTATEGACVVSDQVIVTVNPLPVIDYSFANNQCASSAVQFTSSVTGPGTFSYLWNFGDGTTSNQQNPNHLFAANYGNNSQAFNVVLTVTNTSTNCVNTVTKPVTVKQSPDPTIGSDATTDIFNGQPIFKTCSNSSTAITFTNTSTTSSTNANYLINWGDGTPNLSTASWNAVSHTYQLGFWTLTYTITGQNGCSVTQIYKIFVGSNPAVSLGNPGNTDNCSPSPLTFPINGTDNNPPGTIYTVTFNDGSPAEVYNHPPPSSVTHIFSKSSCGTTSSSGMISYPNSFSANIVASNPCGQSAVGVVPIYVSTPPIADFDMDIPTPITCTNNSVCLTNTSTGSVQILSGGSSCNTVPKIVWIITPSAGITLTSGSLGNDFGLPSPNAWLTGTDIICPKFSLPGTYTITMKVGNRCGSDQIIKTICVESPLSPQFTLTANSGCAPLSVSTTNTTDLTNTCTTPTYQWDVSYASSNCGNSQAYSFTGGTNSSSVSPSFQFTNPGTYTLRISATNSCGTTTTTQNVVVTQPPTATIPNISSICESFPSTVISPTANVTNCGSQPLTYAWSFSGGSPATSTNAVPGAISYSIPGTYSVSLTVTNECGSTTTTSNSFTIKPTPTLNNIPNQEKCRGDLTDVINFQSDIPNTVYNWTNNNPGIGLAVSGTGNINPFSLINNGITDIIATITVTPSFNGCAGSSKTFTITVHPRPTVNSPADVIVCNNGNVGGITFSSTVIGTTFSWINDNSGIGLALNGTGNIAGFTAVNSGITPVVATITVTPSNALGCPGTAKSFTITVNPTPAPLVLTNKEFCNGVITPAITFSNAVAGTTYSWTNSNTSIGLAASGTGAIPSFNPTNTSATPVTSTITVTPTANGCSAPPQTFTITVNPLGDIIFSPGDQTICSGSNSNLVTLSDATAGVTFNWTSVIPPGITGAAASGNSTIPVQTLVNTTNAPLIVIYKATASLSGGVTCEGAEFIYSITVNPVPSVSGNITTTACSGSTFTVSPSNGGGNIIPAGTTYTWSNPIINPVGALTGAGAQNNPQPVISQLLTNTTNNTATATYTVTPASNGCVGQPFQVIVTVNPTPTVNSISDFTVCSGDQTSQVNFSGDVPGTIYNWTSNNTVIGIAATGSGAISAFTTSNPGSTPLTSTITVTPSYNGCNGASKTFTITVNPKPAVNPISNIAYCNNQSGGTISITGSVSGSAFSWTNNNTSIGLAAAGNGDIPAFTATNPGTGAITATITIIPTANGCAGSSRNFTITVNPTPTVFNIPDQEKCKGQLSDVINFSGDVAGTVYNWTNSNPGIGLFASGTANINPFLLQNAGTTILISTITVTPVFNGCPGISKDFKITVHPQSTVVATANSVVCNNESFSGINLSSSVAGTTFTWTNDTPAIGLASNGSGDIPGFTAINTGSAPLISTITVTPFNALGCPGTTKILTITVNPTPGVMVLTDKEFCNGQITTPITFSNVVAGTNYSWTNSNPSIGLPVSGAGNIPAFTPVNTGTDPVTATITVTPNANGCSGLSQTFNITINPTPQITFSQANQVICSGDNTALVTLSSTTAGVTFNWTAIVPPGIVGAVTSGNITIPVQTLINNTNTPLTLTYKAKASVTGGSSCTGPEFIYSITVNPIPSVQGNMTTTICSGSAFVVSPANGNGNTIPSGTTYTWGVPTVSPAGALTGTSDQSTPQPTISQTLINTTNGIVTATYIVTPAFTGCVGQPFNVIITVNPTPTVVSLSDISHCNGEQNAQIDFTGSVSGTIFNWACSNTSIGLAGSGTGLIPAFTAVNTGATPQIATITVTPSANGCNGAPKSFNITVYPILPVSVSIVAGSNNICPGTAVSFTATPVNGGPNSVYQWMVNGLNVGTNNPVFTYTPVDGDTVKCQLLSDAICPSGNPALSNSVKMKVYSNLPANVSISASTNDVCPGESVTFTAVPFNEGFAPVYQWFVNGVKVGTNQPVFTYNPVNGDVVTCQLVSSNSCSSNGVVMSNQIIMVVSPPGLQPSFSFNQNTDCAPVNIIFKNNTASGGIAYIWDFDDGSTYSTATTEDVSHTFQNFTSAPKVFNVSLKVITRFTHCFNILTKQVTVNPELFAGTPVNYTGCSPFTQKFENAYPGAKTYRWISDKNTLLSTDFQPTLTFIAAGKRDSIHTVYLIAESAAGCIDTIVNTIKVSPALEPPSFTWSGNPFCKSVTYTFTNTSAEGPEVFVWDFDDGTIITTNHANQTVTHTFFNAMDIPLPFNVKLTSMNGTYCSLSVTHQIMVAPEYTAGYPVTYQGCDPATRTFDNAYAGSKSYQWISSKGIVLSTQVSPTLTFTAPVDRDSTHLVYLITQSTDGCMDTVVNKVIVRAANKTSFTATPLVGCSPLLVQFTNTSSALTKDFEWHFGDDSDISVLENPRHIYTDPNGRDTIYKVSYIGYNQYGCTDTAFVQIHLLATPQIDFIATPIQQTYPNRTVQLSNKTQGNWTYTWNFGDQTPSVEGNVSSYTYNAPGDYVISLTAKGSNCEAIQHSKVTILPGVPLAAFLPDTAGCAPLKVKFRNLSINTTQYQWDFGNGSQSTDFSPTMIYHDQGTYTIRLKALNEFGVMSSMERSVVVYPVPVAYFKPLPVRVKIPGQAVTFFNYSENGQYYLWDFGDGTVSPDAEPVHQYLQTGLFNIKLFVTSSEGCRDTSVMKEAVEAFSDGLKVPNAFVPDKTGPSADGHYIPGDPRNHIFYPVVASGDLDEYEMLIYNRWGNLLFMTREVEKGWDGYYNGRLCPMDVYVWRIKCKFKSGTVISKAGDVTLIQ